MSFTDNNDRQFMARAIELARRGIGWTNPNPMVGAVIVKDGRIIGEGWHERCGELHAERNAIASLTESAEGSSIYVTLEPCCHQGRTPPCTDAIIENGISKVIIGSADPNPLVNGRGAEILRAHGIEVKEGFMREECDALNPVFFHYITTRRPYVVMKYAMTLDGKIATRTGASRWITSETARRHVHSLRGRYAGIMAGIGTVVADDPMLNCRIEGAHQPLRIILDSRLSISLDSAIVRTAGEYPTLICSAMEGPDGKARNLESMGVEVGYFSGNDRRVSLPEVMKYLGERRIDSVLIEGGGQINESALSEKIVNHVCAYIAPKLFGGARALSPVEGEGVSTPDEAVRLVNPDITRLGEDILLEYDVENREEAVRAGSQL